jgi:DNA/RNA-binding domain of Phe-tRNA-synthetase-like protein
MSRETAMNSEKMIAIYPHRDADNTKVTEATKDVLLMVCGVPGIQKEALDRSAETAIEYITRFCNRTKTCKY